MPCAAFHADEAVKETSMACSFEIKIFSEEHMFAQRQEKAKASLSVCDKKRCSVSKSELYVEPTWLTVNLEHPNS